MTAQYAASAVPTAAHYSEVSRLKFRHKVTHGAVGLKSLDDMKYNQSRQTRHEQKMICEFRCKKDLCYNSFFPCAVRELNELPA